MSKKKRIKDLEARIELLEARQNTLEAQREAIVYEVVGYPSSKTRMRKVLNKIGRVGIRRDK